jgi:hypothetical protein
VFGCTFQLCGKGNHLRVVISKSHGDDGRVLVVNLTDAQNWQDTACVVQPGEHPFVTKPSAIAYRKAMAVSPETILEHIKRGTFARSDDMPAQVLQRTIDGAKASDDLPQKFLKYLS